jgi:hypothetical protein
MAKAKNQGNAEPVDPTAGTEGTPVADAPAKEKKAREPVNKKYEFVKAPGEGDKLAPQARLIVSEIEKAGTIDRATLCKNLAANGDFKTRQPVERIVTYYQKDLEAAGFIKLAA